MRLKPAIAAFLLTFVAGAALSAPYYARVHSFAPLTKVRSQQINNEFNAIQTSFALLPANATGGFSGTVVVGTATGTTHALTYGQLQILDTDIDAVSTYTINNLIGPVSGGDAANKTYVDATVAAGMPPGALAITSLGVGTGTANQVVTINGAGTAVVGLAQSSIDAGTLDSLNSTQFLRSDQSGTLTGDLTATGDVVLETNNVSTLRAKDTVSVAQSLIRLDQYDNIAIGHSSGVDYLLLDTLLDQKFRVASTEAFRITGTGTKTTGDHEVTGDLNFSGGSAYFNNQEGIYVTKLDGVTSYFAFRHNINDDLVIGSAVDTPDMHIQALDNIELKIATISRLIVDATGISVNGSLTVTGNVDGRDVATDGTKLDGIESGATADQTKADIDALGIDAETFDGLVRTQFLRKDASQTITGTHIISNVSPGFYLDETDAAADARYWYPLVNAEKFTIQTRDDAKIYQDAVFSVDRNSNVTSVNNITLAGDLILGTNNTSAVQVKESGGTARDVVKITAGNALVLGSSSLNQTNYYANVYHLFHNSVSEVARLTSSIFRLSVNDMAIQMTDSVGANYDVLNLGTGDDLTLGHTTGVDSVKVYAAGTDGFEYYEGGSLEMHLGNGWATFGGQTTIAYNENTDTGVGIASGSGQTHWASASTNDNLYINKIGAIDGDYVAFNRNAVEVGSIDYASGVIRYNTTSDYRLKDNIQLLDNGLVLVNQLQPKTFNYLTHPDDTVFGFLAHEVQEVVPEAVTGEKDGEKMQQLDASKLIPILTKAIQELSARVQYLESQTIH